MASLAATLVGAVVQVQNLVGAGVLAAFFALAAVAVGRIVIDPDRRPLPTLVRGLAATAFLLLGGIYALFTADFLVWSGPALAVAGVTAVLLLLPLAVHHVMGTEPRRPGLVPFLIQTILLLLLLILALVTLMRAGFLALTEDQPVLLVDVTGKTRPEVVKWAPPGQPSREEVLTTYRVVFRNPDGEAVAEAWLYGEQVAVKGRVLRLSPILNAAGVSNLFEPQFAHNGYRTASRHGDGPHQAVPLSPRGPCAVHPWWRPLQSRILDKVEKGTGDLSPWTIRSVTTESTYYPLVDREGRPLQKTFRLVLTPGGLSAS